MVASHIVLPFDRFLLPSPIVTIDESATIIWLAGDQDLAVVDALRAALVAASASFPTGRQRAVIVDLRDVTFIDTATARALINATRIPARTAHSLTLRAASVCVRRMLDICGQGDLLEVA
jgi:anti-anti-sigma factor